MRRSITDHQFWWPIDVKFSKIWNWSGSDEIRHRRLEGPRDGSQKYSLCFQYRIAIRNILRSVIYYLFSVSINVKYSKCWIERISENLQNRHITNSGVCLQKYSIVSTFGPRWAIQTDQSLLICPGCQAMSYFPKPRFESVVTRYRIGICWVPKAVSRNTSYVPNFGLQSALRPNQWQIICSLCQQM